MKKKNSFDEEEDIVDEEDIVEEEDIAFADEDDFEEQLIKEDRRRMYKQCAVRLAFYIGFIFLFFSQVRFVVIETPSIPYRLCLQVFYLTPQKGDICAFRKRGSTVCKYIAAVEGDTISNINDDIYINGEYRCRAERTEDLTPVDDFIVPSGHVFVLGTHEDSLDSRFREFGLVKTSDIEGKVMGLWKW